MYHDTECYPVFPCIEKNQLYDCDYSSFLDRCYLVLLNCTLTDATYELLQRGIGKFYLAYEAVINEHLVDDYNEFDPINGVISSHPRIRLLDATTVVLKSTSYAYNQVPRFEHRNMEFDAFQGICVREDGQDKNLDSDFDEEFQLPEDPFSNGRTDQLTVVDIFHTDTLGYMPQTECYSMHLSFLTFTLYLSGILKNLSCKSPAVAMSLWLFHYYPP